VPPSRTPSRARSRSDRPRPVVRLLLALGLLACSASRGPLRAQEQEPDDGAAWGIESGRDLFLESCAACHQPTGQGLVGAIPPLAGSDFLVGDRTRAIATVVNGLQGPIEVNGERYDGLMPAHRFLSDERLAAILSYVRAAWGNDASPVLPEDVRRVRATTQPVAASACQHVASGAPCPRAGSGAACCATGQRSAAPAQAGCGERARLRRGPGWQAGRAGGSGAPAPRARGAGRGCCCVG